MRLLNAQNVMTLILVGILFCIMESATLTAQMVLTKKASNANHAILNVKHAPRPTHNSALRAIQNPNSHSLTEIHAHSSARSVNMATMALQNVSSVQNHASHVRVTQRHA
jgi:hypothetical protein